MRRSFYNCIFAEVPQIQVLSIPCLLYSSLCALTLPAGWPHCAPRSHKPCALIAKEERDSKREHDVDRRSSSRYPQGTSRCWWSRITLINKTWLLGEPATNDCQFRSSRAVRPSISSA
ncbi:hypothetical protein HGRIS_011685 [Hohenbuehelia grisea]|uniref:Secreted protein n=1 Tax=Hohenbuehelia grisea TaxID=104357 RepID=A0ABR3JWV1_9AGAR